MSVKRYGIYMHWACWPLPGYICMQISPSVLSICQQWPEYLAMVEEDDY